MHRLPCRRLPDNAASTASQIRPNDRSSSALVAPEVIWLGILNATLCTFVPVLLVMLAIEKVGASIAAQVGMIGPLSTILLSVWLLDEPFTIWVAAGTTLVVSGVWWLARARKQQ